MKLIDETPGREDAIRRVIIDAFGRHDEARLVDQLRSDGDLVLSLIAELDETVCGHLALSRLKSPPGGLALAPVSVLTSEQGHGVGSALIRRSIGRAREIGYRSIFVLGEPDFYNRFGFSIEAAKAYPCQYAGPYFMALHLSDEERVPQSVVYPGAFEELS